MAKLKTVYICGECGYETGRWLGRCPECKTYDSFIEDVVEKSASSSGAGTAKLPSHKAARIVEIAPSSEIRTKTGIAELDRVLSGGLVQGSVTLVGGEPGVGKSTLLLQICRSICFNENAPLLYVSGEESLAQIKLRADRIGVSGENLYVVSETGVRALESAVNDLSPRLLIVDSIQTMTDENFQNSPGSIVQIRECANFLMKLAKTRNISIVIIGHVTKDGALAGPKILEHMVDTVLYFEGDRHLSHRIIRSVKNRFGSTDEIGVFEMRENGLCEITNPSEYMLAGRPLDAPGSVVTCSLEGTRPILAEVQALVCRSGFGTPRRMAAGMDYNRTVMLIALLEKRAGYAFSNFDSYVNIAGGLKINEPALDLAAVAALASSYRNKPLNPRTAVFGEAGLTGEARAVTFAEKRVYEASKLGFNECVLPQANLKGLKAPEGIKVYGVANINEMLEFLFT